MCRKGAVHHHCCSSFPMARSQVVMVSSPRRSQSMKLLDRHSGSPQLSSSQRPVGAPELVHLRSVRVARMQDQPAPGMPSNRAASRSLMGSHWGQGRRGALGFDANVSCQYSGAGYSTGPYTTEPWSPTGGTVPLTRAGKVQPSSPAVAVLVQRLSQLQSPPQHPEEAPDSQENKQEDTTSLRLMSAGPGSQVSPSRMSTRQTYPHLDGICYSMKKVHQFAKEDCSNLEAMQREHALRVSKMQQEVTQWRDKSMELWNELSSLRSELSTFNNYHKEDAPRNDDRQGSGRGRDVHNS